MNVHIEKEIWIPEGIYCNTCSYKKTYSAQPLCVEFDTHLGFEGETPNVIKCNACFSALQKEITNDRY